MRKGFSGSIPFENQHLWHSRGYLKHYEGESVYQLITYRQDDSLPKSVLKKIDNEVKHEDMEKIDLKRRKLIEKYLDAGYGSCLLGIPKVAEAVIENWKFFDGVRYELISGVVMPNHVHVLVKIYPNWALGKIVWTWKKYISKFIYQENVIAASACGAPDKIWQREYWDRFIRDEDHYKSAINYILENPYKAGLVKKPQVWPWVYLKN